jgi:hypothetical protein
MEAWMALLDPSSQRLEWLWFGWGGKVATKRSISVSREVEIVEEILLPSGLGTPDNAVCLGLSAGQAWSFVALHNSPFPESFIDIEFLAVQPAQRGCGIGLQF